MNQFQFPVSPLSVKIINDAKPIKVSDHRTIGFEVKGARPRPVVTWWMDSIRVDALNKVVSIGFLVLLLYFHSLIFTVVVKLCQN